MSTQQNVVDILRQLLRLDEQNQGNGSEKLTKQQCQALYPDGNDSTLFFEIEEKLGSLDKAETLLVLCKYDFTLARSIAEEAASLFHCNMKFFKKLYKRFDKNVTKVMDYLRKFKNHQPQNAETTHCKAALKVLQSFRENGAEADIFLENFRNDSEEAQTFLKKFDDSGEEAKSFLSTFKNDIERTTNFLHKFDDKGSNANEYLKQFANVTEGETFLQRFADETEANEFVQVFNGSFGCASQFIKPFNDPKEALEYFETVKKECDEKTDNSFGENCKWLFDEKTKTLFIGGSGEMADYVWRDDAPWSSKRGQIENAVVGEGITTIGNGAFCDCFSLTSVVIPRSIRMINGSAFSQCLTLTSIIIPKGIATIGNWAFYDCSHLTSITLPKGIVAIGEDVFHDCSSLTSVTIPNGVVTIGKGAFSSCHSLKSITIPTSVMTIGSRVFSGCSSLTSIDISSVITIGKRVFSKCYSLTTATLSWRFEKHKKNIFEECDNLKNINWI